jgi:hypothetical protein
MSDHFKVNGVRTIGVWLSSGENVRTYRISIVRTMSQTQKLYTQILKIKMDYTRGKIMTTNHNETWL